MSRARRCEILKLYDCISMADLRSKDLMTAKKPEKNPRFARENSLVTCSIQLARATTVDTFKGVAQMGRFTLRDEGRTIAIGKITELPTKDRWQVSLGALLARAAGSHRATTPTLPRAATEHCRTPSGGTASWSWGGPCSPRPRTRGNFEVSFGPSARIFFRRPCCRGRPRPAIGV
ncbi:unnamed protein product [Prorocentrum cordatum]|uniref:GTP-eEF1A C-terminal domain-containing protein n=1 Tax=Prorocentrum cordatum TaxID=2364126 RepID=A0ABN9UTB0_9DINO|nr:unnamed protein product [Polarella glacialis]